MISRFYSWAKSFAGFVNKRPKTKLVLNTFLIVLIGWLTIVSFSPGVKSQILPDFNSLDAEQLIDLTNQERLKHNLSPLFPNDVLTKAAANKAQDLLKGQYFSHNSPEGKKFSAWVKEVNYPYSIVGENLAEGFSSDQTIIKAWMDSPGHRDNILHPEYKEIGIAVLKGSFKGKETKMVVQIFGVTLERKISEVLPLYLNSKINILNKLNSFS